MFYDELIYWCEKKGVSPNRAMNDCDISPSAPSKWKKGLTPRYELQKKLADYFGITIDELNDHAKTYPTDDVNEIRDELFERRKILFDLSSKASKEDLDTMIKIFRGLVDG